MQSTSDLQDEISAALAQIPIDIGGGCSAQKAGILAWLIRKYQLGRTLDIGVYRGRSLIPQAIAHARHTHGVVYGVDPFSMREARQEDNTRMARELERWLAATDFDALWASLQSLTAALGLQTSCRLVRMTSAAAAEFFQQQQITFGLIHIDGNHDTAKVMRDIELYLP